MGPKGWHREKARENGNVCKSLFSINTNVVSRYIAGTATRNTPPYEVFPRCSIMLYPIKEARLRNPGESNYISGSDTKF